MSKFTATSKGMGRGTAQAGVPAARNTRPPRLKKTSDQNLITTKKEDYRTKSYMRSMGGGQNDAGGGGRKPLPPTLERGNTYAMPKPEGGQGGEGEDYGSGYYEGTDATEFRDVRVPFKTVSGKGKKKKRKKK